MWKIDFENLRFHRRIKTTRQRILQKHFKHKKVSKNGSEDDLFLFFRIDDLKKVWKNLNQSKIAQKLKTWSNIQILDKFSEWLKLFNPFLFLFFKPIFVYVFDFHGNKRVISQISVRKIIIFRFLYKIFIKLN